MRLIPSTHVFRHLFSRRENRGGLRCVRARIIGREIGLSTRCHIHRQNYLKLLKENDFIPKPPGVLGQIFAILGLFGLLDFDPAEFKLSYLHQVLPAP